MVDIILSHSAMWSCNGHHIIKWADLASLTFRSQVSEISKHHKSCIPLTFHQHDTLSMVTQTNFFIDRPVVVKHRHLHEGCVVEKTLTFWECLSHLCLDQLGMAHVPKLTANKAAIPLPRRRECLGS
jgi:hypothetical protein